MAAGEDQAESIILDLLIIERSCGAAHFPFAVMVERKIFLCSFIEARAPAHPIDGFEACRGNQPGARLVRNTSPRPGLQSGGECLMHGLFGEIQISEEAHQRRQNPARFRSVKSFNGPAELFGHRRWHLPQASERSMVCKGPTAWVLINAFVAINSRIVLNLEVSQKRGSRR